KSNHSNTLPIVAATISRLIEGGFGSTAAVNVSAVISGLPCRVRNAAFIRQSAHSDKSHRGASRHSPDSEWLLGSFAHPRRPRQRINRAVSWPAPQLFTPQRTADFHPPRRSPRHSGSVAYGGFAQSRSFRGPSEARQPGTH